MDQLPAERPILIAQATESRALAQREPIYRIVELGPIDQMRRLQDWKNATTFEQHLKLREHLNPGQRVVLAKPENGNAPVLYINEHRPYPLPTFQEFQALLKTKTFDMLTSKQLAPIAAILGDKADPKKFYSQAYLEDMGGQKGVSVLFTRLSDSKTGRAFYFISDSKSHTVEEFGYEGAEQKKDEHWRTEADEMFRSVQFKKSKP